LGAANKRGQLITYYIPHHLGVEKQPVLVLGVVSSSRPAAGEFTSYLLLVCLGSSLIQQASDFLTPSFQATQRQQASIHRRLPVQEKTMNTNLPSRMFGCAAAQRNRQAGRRRAPAAPCRRRAPRRCRPRAPAARRRGAPA
jgi:hypothetical protein